METRSRLSTRISMDLLSVAVALLGGIAFSVLLEQAFDIPYFFTTGFYLFFCGIVISHSDLLLRFLPKYRGGSYLVRNVPVLLIVAVLVYIFIFLGIDLWALNLITGLAIGLGLAFWLELGRKGHFDRWLWLLSDVRLKKFRENFAARFLRTVTLILILSTILDEILSFIYIGVQLRRVHGITDPFFRWNNLNNLGQVGLFFLLGLFIWLLLTTFVALRKYELISAGDHFTIERASLDYLKDYRDQKRGGKAAQFNFERFIQFVQMDIVLWALILAGTIAIFEVFVFVLVREVTTFRFLFFMIPVFISLFFGVFGHTTSSEIGGVIGVLMAAFLTWVISVFFPNSYSWNTDLFFLIFSAALVSWIVGLLGGIFLKGHIRMSLVGFAIEGEPPDPLGFTEDFLDEIKSDLADVYSQACSFIFGGSAEKAVPQQSNPANLILSDPETGVQYLPDNYLHLKIEFNQKPVTQQLSYALLLNRLTSAGKQAQDHLPMPVLPVNFYQVHTDSDIVLDTELLETGHYRLCLWSKSEPIELPSLFNGSPAGFRLGYKKTLSDFFDHMITRSVQLSTDVFCFLADQDERKKRFRRLVIVCLGRGRTSTKSYVNMEMDIVMHHLLSRLIQSGSAGKSNSSKVSRFRLYNPKASIYDHMDAAQRDQPQGELRTQGDKITPVGYHYLQAALKHLPDRNIIPNFTQDIRKKLMVFTLQVSVTAIFTALGQQGIFSEAINIFLDAFF